MRLYPQPAHPPPAPRAALAAQPSPPIRATIDRHCSSSEHSSTARRGSDRQHMPGISEPAQSKSAPEMPRASSTEMALSTPGGVWCTGKPAGSGGREGRAGAALNSPGVNSLSGRGRGGAERPLWTALCSVVAAALAPCSASFKCKDCGKWNTLEKVVVQPAGDAGGSPLLRRTSRRRWSGGSTHQTVSRQARPVPPRSTQPSAAGSAGMPAGPPCRQCSWPAGRGVAGGAACGGMSCSRAVWAGQWQKSQCWSVRIPPSTPSSQTRLQPRQRTWRSQ